MSFSGWLRSNAEYFLFEATERDLAKKYGLRPPVERRGLMPFLWRRVFVPVYRVLPWGVRRWIMGIMPGSHRQRWQDRAPPYRKSAA